MVFIHLQTIISFCHAFDRQTDGDGQTDVDSKTVRMLGSRTVKTSKVDRTGHGEERDRNEWEWRLPFPSSFGAPHKILDLPWSALPL